MINRRLLVALFFLCCVGAAHAQRVVTFGRGTAEVTLPESFIATEQNDGSLRAVFGAAGENRLEFTVGDVTSDKGGRNMGELYVQAQAKKKDVKLFQTPGKVVYMEPADDKRLGEKSYRAARWQIGFGNSVVVMTLTAPAQGSPELTQFLGKSLEDVIDSLRRKAP